METEWRLWTDYDAYASFFDHDWAKRLSDKTQDTPFDKCFMHLAFQWKGAANVCALPRIAIDMCSSFATGYVNKSPSHPENLIEALKGRVLNNITPPLTDVQAEAVTQNISRLNMEVSKAMSENPYAFDTQALWSWLINQSEFGLAILMSLRSTYSSLFFGYEDFLIKIIRYKLQKPDIRTGVDFYKSVDAALGSNMSVKYWTRDELKVPRFIRHALAHAGGYETKDLKKISHGYEVVDGRIQITILDTRTLFVTLSEAVENLVDMLLEETNASN